ncbi:MAG: radical SAM protein [Candidatus Brocadiia bacterium]|nr:MAG: radical SAM protein [Candidatus Brocadiia bacterium]
MSASEAKYLFGPVPSRRLGLSLGVDVIPFKACTLDCVYCQLGHTREKTLERKVYVRPEPVLEELRVKLTRPPRPDYISLSGSGEPTLNSALGEIIDGIKNLTEIPVALLTNGTLLYDRSVLRNCLHADVILPSLDAPDAETFEKINRPHHDISIEKLVEGLCLLRDQFKGQIWLEVFLIEPINTQPIHIKKFRAIIEKIRPDKIQLNTAVRPTAESWVKALSAEMMERIAGEIGNNCEVIADFSCPKQIRNDVAELEQLLSILKRRPCSVDDISSAMQINPNAALKLITILLQGGQIQQISTQNKSFFKAV